MRVSAVITNKKRESFKNLNGNKSSVISAVIIAFGIIAGAILYSVNSKALSSNLLDYFISFSMDFSHKTKPEIFSGLVVADIIYLVIMSVMGTCAFGTVAVVCLSSVNSMGLGMLTAYIYDKFALKGIEYCLIVFLPGKFFLILAMILLTQNCIVTSNSIRLCVCKPGDGVVDFKKYTMRIFVISLLMMLSGLIDFATLIGFSSLFDFA